MRHTTAEEWVTLLVAAALSLVVLIIWLYRYAFPRGPRTYRVGNDWDRKLVEFERDRVLSAAKGIGSTAAGFLTAVVLAFAKSEITAQVSRWSLLGSVLGVVGALLLAATMSASTRSYTQSFP
jgi:hypothetical protein